jgi:hypothetical protein
MLKVRLVVENNVHRGLRFKFFVFTDVDRDVKG